MIHYFAGFTAKDIFELRMMFIYFPVLLLGIAIFSYAASLTSGAKGKNKKLYKYLISSGAVSLIISLCGVFLANRNITSTRVSNPEWIAYGMLIVAGYCSGLIINEQKSSNKKS